MQPVVGEPPQTATPTLATLLIVDDEEHVLAALRRLFRTSPYHLVLANSGRQGLEILASEPVDVVMSDMRMPEMDGATFLGEVAQKWPHTVRLLLTGYSDLRSTILAVNRGHIYQHLSKPWDENDLRLAVERAVHLRLLEKERLRLEELTRKQNEELRELNATLERRVEASTGKLRQALQSQQLAHDKLKRGYAGVIKTVAKLAEMREGAGSGHARRVAGWARRLAEKLGLNAAGIQNVFFAALLHDVGRIGLDDNLVRKPFEALAAGERAEVVQHPVIGQALLMELELLQDAALLVRHHHENYDGTGFPDGLRGEAIPLGARLLAVANDYDALLSGRLQPRRLLPEEARRFLQDHRGTRYDPAVVEAFLEQLADDDRQGEGEGATPPGTEV